VGADCDTETRRLASECPFRSCVNASHLILLSGMCTNCTVWCSFVTESSHGAFEALVNAMLVSQFDKARTLHCPAGMDSLRLPAALLLLFVVGCRAVLDIGRSPLAAKGTRKPQSTSPNHSWTGLNRIRRCSVFGSSKGGRAGGQNDRLEHRRSDSTNNDRKEAMLPTIVIRQLLSEEKINSMQNSFGSHAF
jgi:hypothetical protein